MCIATVQCDWAARKSQQLVRFSGQHGVRKSTAAEAVKAGCGKKTRRERETVEKKTTVCAPFYLDRVADYC